MELKRMLFTVLAVALLTMLARGKPDWLVERRVPILLCLALVAIVAWFNFGRFHSGDRFIHDWEQFHYVVGSKYFPELGYDGLLPATLLAVEEQGLEGRIPDMIRDQRTFALVPRDQIRQHGLEVRGRFNDQRWDSFKADITPVRLPKGLWQDHGYNPTPAWTFMGRLFTAHLPVTRNTMGLYAAVDLILLAGIFWLLYRTFGLTVACCAMIVFGTNYCSRFYWNGGGFLRQDWLFAVTAGLCLLKQRRFGLAGAALAYATAVRVFPLFFVLPLIVHAGRCWRDGKSVAWVRPFGIGFAGVGLAMLVAGSFTGRGFDAWIESVHRVEHLQTVVLQNDVGLRMPFITSIDNLRGKLSDRYHLWDDTRVSRDYAQMAQSRAWIIALAQVFLGALVVWAMWRARAPEEASVLGMAAIFTLIEPTSYYWIMLILLPLRRPLQSTLAFLLAMMTVYALHPPVYYLYHAGHIETLTSAVAYGPTSLFLTAMFVYWLLPGRDPPPQTDPVPSDDKARLSPRTPGI